MTKLTCEVLGKIAKEFQEMPIDECEVFCTPTQFFELSVSNSFWARFRRKYIGITQDEAFVIFDMTNNNAEDK